MFVCKLCGIKTDHNKGFIFHSKNQSYYCFLYFLTPFFCEIDGKRIIGDVGDCIIHKKGDNVIHGPLSDEESFINNWMLFDCNDNDIEAFNIPYNKIFKIGSDADFEFHLSKIMREEAIADEYSKQTISSYISQLLVEFKRKIKMNKIVEKTIFDKFSSTRTYILNHYSENWTLEKMAELVDYSVSRFCTIYKSFFNQSPMDDLLQKRLNISKRLLAIKAYKISDISSICGFTSQHYFSKFFKAHTGKSPREYLKQL